MQYLNLTAAVAQIPKFIEASGAQVKTWLALFAYCHLHENNGIIRGCSKWSDAVVKQLGFCSMTELRSSSPLWSWSGESDLHVVLYNRAEQAARQRKSKLRREAAFARWGKKKVVPMQKEKVSTG